METKGVCTVCGKPPKAKTLLECELCNKLCHMQCTLSKKLGVPVKCETCGPRSTSIQAPSRSVIKTERTSGSQTATQHSSSATNSPADGPSPLNNTNVGDRSALQACSSPALRMSGHNTSQGERTIRELDETMVRSGTTISAVVGLANGALSSINEATDRFNRTMADKLAEISSKLAVIPAISSDLSNLISKLSSMEAIIIAQSSKLEELHLENSSLVEESRVLAGRILTLEDRISAMAECRCIKTALSGEGRGDNLSSPNPSSPEPDRSRSDNLGRVGRTPSNDINGVLVSGVLSRPAPADVLSDVALAVLGSLVPTLDGGDIAEVRMLGPRGAADREGAGEPAKGNSSGSGRPPSLLVRFTSRDRLTELLQAKRGVNYFNTKDVKSVLSTISLPYVCCGFSPYLLR